MSVPAESLVGSNVELSIQRFLASRWTVPASYVDADFDPDGLGGGASKPVWGALSWVEQRAGTKGVSLLQIDVVSRRTADPLARLARAARDSLVLALRVRSIPLYDFSGVVEEDDEETPIAGNVVLVQTADGRIGEPSGIVGPSPDREFWRVVVTYRFRLLSDASAADYY